MSGEDNKHVGIFQKMLEKTPDQYEPDGIDADLYYEYMSVLASEYVFTKKDKGAELACKIKSDKEAIEMGIKIEKDSILFYEGMRRVVPEYAHKVIDEIILEEQSHLKQLVDLKNRL